MNRRSFAGMAGNAAGTRSRQGAVATLVAAGVATALARPENGAARKRRNSGPRCKQQKGLCTGVLVPGCGGDQDCIARIRGCCERAASCDIGGFLDCL